MAEKQKISLVVADVDGTLVTEEKVLTKRAQAAVRALHEAGIRFAITSGRPPLGMAMLKPERWNISTSLGWSPMVAISAAGTSRCADRYATTAPLFAS